MADKWEMCEVDLFEIWIWSPGQPLKKMRHEKYLYSLGKETQKTDLNDDTLTYLLENGWEPYESDHNRHFLKRMINS